MDAVVLALLAGAVAWGWHRWMTAPPWKPVDPPRFRRSDDGEA